MWSISSQEVTALLTRLQERHKLEEIAFYLDKSYATVHKWSKGTRLPDKGDYELLKRMEAEK